VSNTTSVGGNTITQIAKHEQEFKVEQE